MRTVWLVNIWRLFCIFNFFAAIRTEIRNKNKAGTKEQKAAVKAILTDTGKKLDEIDDIEILTNMLEVFE